ncbi:MAG: hypothetical protein QXO20_07510, partial [Candidatus Bathyarchaeia archaeon]
EECGLRYKTYTTASEYPKRGSDQNIETSPLVTKAKKKSRNNKNSISNASRFARVVFKFSKMICLIPSEP